MNEQLKIPHDRGARNEHQARRQVELCFGEAQSEHGPAGEAGQQLAVDAGLHEIAQVAGAALSQHELKGYCQVDWSKPSRIYTRIDQAAVARVQDAKALCLSSR